MDTHTPGFARMAWKQKPLRNRFFVAKTAVASLLEAKQGLHFSMTHNNPELATVDEKVDLNSFYKDALVSWTNVTSFRIHSVRECVEEGVLVNDANMNFVLTLHGLDSPNVCRPRFLANSLTCLRRRCNSHWRAWAEIENVRPKSFTSFTKMVQQSLDNLKLMQHTGTRWLSAFFLYTAP